MCTCVYQPIRSVAVLPGDRIVSGSADNTLRIWDLTSGQCVAVLEGHKGVRNLCKYMIYVITGYVFHPLFYILQPVRSVAVLPGGRLASGSADKTVYIWDIATGTCVRVLQGHTNVRL